MIYYNFITIILFLVIFILILKFKDFNIENFYDDEENTIPTIDCSDNTNNSKNCNIIRLMKDRRINEHILSLLKEKNNFDTKNSIDENNRNIDRFLENTFTNKEKIDNILNKLRKIDTKTTEDTIKYNKQKKERDRYINQFIDDVKNDNEKKAFILNPDKFREQNDEIIQKLAEYYNEIKLLNKKPKLTNENILILKNIGNKNELNLLNIDKKIKIFNEYKAIESSIYYLFINDNCVNFIDKYNYKFEPCNPTNNFYFTVNKIEDFSTYNKFIRYNKSNTKDDEVVEDEANIEYPFYIICPLNTIGVCVTLDEKKLSFQPIRNNSNQRFTKILNSNYCSY